MYERLFIQLVFMKSRIVRLERGDGPDGSGGLTQAPALGGGPEASGGPARARAPCAHPVVGLANSTPGQLCVRVREGGWRGRDGCIDVKDR